MAARTLSRRPPTKRRGCAVALAALLPLALLSACATPARPSRPHTWSYLETRLAPYWWYDRVEVSAARGKGVMGAGRTIAIVDTGVLPGHEDLPNIAQGVATCGSKPGDATDRNGHGTQLAGIALGQDPGNVTRGLAPSAALLAIKVDCGVVSPQALMQGVQRAIDAKADVVLLALGAYPTTTPELEPFLADRIGKSPGVLFVVASIWDGSAEFPLPAWTRRDNVIVVAPMTLDQSGEEIPFSTRVGDIWAPGRDVETASIDPAAASPSPAAATARQRAHEPFSMQGASAASSIVAGCAALVKEKTGLSGAPLRTALLTAAEPRPNLGPGNSGRLNCGKAVP